MAENLSIEVLEKEVLDSFAKFSAKRQVAESLIKAGDLLLGNSYLREAVLLNAKFSQKEKQLKAIKAVMCS